MQYIATRPIMDLCERSARKLGERMSRRWWEQDIAKKKAVKAAESDGEEAICKEEEIPLETTTGQG